MITNNSTGNPWWIQPQQTIQPTNILPTNVAVPFVPVECGNNTCQIYFVLDASGSMGGTRKEAAMEAYNSFVADQAKDATETGVKTFINLFTFNGSEVKTIVRNRDVLEAEKLNQYNYVVGGGTNLVDAIGDVMLVANTDLMKQPQKLRHSTIFVIITDGEENSSYRFTSQYIKKMVSLAGDSRWSFVYLGAGIDAFASSEAYGFSKQTTITLSGSSASINSGVSTASRVTRDFKGLYNTSNTMNMADVYNKVAVTDEEAKDALK